MQLRIVRPGPHHCTTCSACNAIRWRRSGSRDRESLFCSLQWRGSHSTGNRNERGDLHTHPSAHLAVTIGASVPMHECALWNQQVEISLITECIWVALSIVFGGGRYCWRR